MRPLNQWTATDLADFAKKVDKTTWIKAGIGVAVAGVVFIFFIWPAWFERGRVLGQIRAIQDQVATLQMLTSKREEWLRSQTDFKKFIQDTKDHLFQTSETSLLLGAISKLADESKVAIIASRPKDATEEIPKPFDQQYKANLFDFTVEGGYHAVATFVSRIESHPKLLRIQVCQLKPSEKTPEAHLADMTLSAMSFEKGKI